MRSEVAIRSLRSSISQTKGKSVERERRTDGYGSKWKKWALVYLGVGAIVYLVIYLAVSSGGGYGG
jgi:hypothetical protein